MADALDLSKLDIDELSDLINKANRLRKELVDAKRSELIKQLEELDAIASPVRVTSSSTKQRSSSKYTHKHPVSGKTWLGRGGVPEEWKKIVPENATREERAQALAPYRIDL